LILSACKTRNYAPIHAKSSENFTVLTVKFSYHFIRIDTPNPSALRTAGTSSLFPTLWHNRSHLCHPHFSALHFSAIPSFVFFRFFRLSPKFSVCQTGMARAFSPYLPRRAHFTWGVAPGWYRSGLWPLLSLFSDQSANGAPYTTVEQRRTKRPTPRSPSTIQGLNARSITAGRSRIDAPGDGRAPGVVASSNALAAARRSFPPHFSAIHFSAIPSFAFFRFFRLSPKNHPSAFSVCRKKEKKTKECYCPVLAFCGSDLDYTRADALLGGTERTTLNAQRATFNPDVRATGWVSVRVRTPLTGSLYPTRRQQRGDFSPPHFSALHFSAIPTLVSLRSRFSRGNHGDAYTPDAIPSPTPWDNRSHLSRPHLSAIHFSAIPSFAFLGELVRVFRSRRRSRLTQTQRGATECQVWNKRIYLTATVWVRLRRAGVYGPWSIMSHAWLTENPS
jgi:hypothetical protein